MLWEESFDAFVLLLLKVGGAAFVEGCFPQFSPFLGKKSPPRGLIEVCEEGLKG